MPVHQVAHAGIPSTLLQRDEIAQGITRIQHDVTNASKPFQGHDVRSLTGPPTERVGDDEPSIPAGLR